MKIVPFTVSTLVEAFHDSSPRTAVCAVSENDRQVYEPLAGVRLNGATAVTLLLIEVSPLLSKVGGVPVLVPGSQPVKGPRSAFLYQKPMSLAPVPTAG